MRFQEASIRVEEAVALERLKRPLEVAFKSAQPNEWKNPLDQTQGVRLDAYQIGQRPLLICASAEKSNRKITEAGILGQRGYQGIDMTRAKTRPVHHTVNIGCIAIARRRFH